MKDKVVATFEASRKPEYTTFLKNFGQFVVAKLDEKSVGKDEYLFSAISDLRHEMHSLSKVVRNRDFGSQVRISDALLHGFAGKDHQSERDFIFEKLVNSTDVVALMDELEDVGSPAFKALMDEYLINHVPSTQIGKGRSISDVRKRLVEAVRFHRGLIKP